MSVSESSRPRASNAGAGAIPAMISDTMIPEAFETAHSFAGLITVLEYLVAFTLSKLSG